MKIMAIEICRRIRKHVTGGGWLGASWPRYIVPEGATNAQLEAGLALAERLEAKEGGDLWGESQYNFNSP